MSNVLYLCDRRACPVCGEFCSRTSDISHAVNFELDGDVYTEKILQIKPLEDISENLKELGTSVKTISKSIDDIGDISKTLEKFRKDFKK